MLEDAPNAPPQDEPTPEDPELSEVEIHLPLFKQGDDLDHYLEKGASPVEALALYAGQLSRAVTQLLDVQERIAKLPSGHVALHGCTHFACLMVPYAVGAEMTRDGIAAAPLGDEDEDDATPGSAVDVRLN
jgi:hypothetical protein